MKGVILRHMLRMCVDRPKGVRRGGSTFSRIVPWLVTVDRALVLADAPG